MSTYNKTIGCVSVYFCWGFVSHDCIILIKKDINMVNSEISKKNDEMINTIALLRIWHVFVMFLVYQQKLNNL
jgi:hypothetical protein